MNTRHIFCLLWTVHTVCTLHSLQYGIFLDQFLDDLYTIKDICIIWRPSLTVGDLVSVLKLWHRLFFKICVRDFMSKLLGQSDIQPY